MMMMTTTTTTMIQVTKTMKMTLRRRKRKRSPWASPTAGRRGRRSLRAYAARASRRRRLYAPASRCRPRDPAGSPRSWCRPAGPRRLGGAVGLQAVISSPCLDDLRDAIGDQGNRPAALVERDRHAAALTLDDVATFRGRSPLAVATLLRDCIADEQFSLVGQAFAALLPSAERAAWIAESVGEERATSVFGKTTSAAGGPHPTSSPAYVRTFRAMTVDDPALQGSSCARVLTTARATDRCRRAWSTNGLAGCVELCYARRRCLAM